MHKLQQQVIDYVEFYNNKRPHQAINYKKPCELFQIQPLGDNVKK